MVEALESHELQVKQAMNDLRSKFDYNWKEENEVEYKRWEAILDTIVAERARYRDVVMRAINENK